MNKRTILIGLICVTINVCSFSQSISKYEDILYKQVLNNFTINYVLDKGFLKTNKCFQESKNIIDRGHCLDETMILDTNSFIPISFNESEIDFNLSNLLLIEYIIDLNTTVYRINDSIENYMFCKGLNSYSSYMTRGLVAIDTIQNSLYFISGYLFYLDNFDDFSDINYSENELKKYVQLKYYNYSPTDIKITKKWITFNTKIYNYNNGFTTKETKTIKLQYSEKKGEINRIY